MSKRWTELPERGTRSALLLIRWIARVLGRDIACALLWPVALYFVITGYPQRRASRAYLSRAFGRRASVWQVVRHFYCYAVTILDRVYLLDGHRELFELTIRGDEALLANVRAKRGCLLLGAHIGSFEIMRAIGVTLPIRVLMNEEHNSVIASVFNEQNRAIAENVIALGSPAALLRAKESIDDGYLLGALGDRVLYADKTVRCKFLNSETSFPRGPMALAAALQVPVIMFFSLYRGSNRYDVHFEHLTDGIVRNRRERDADIAACVRRYAARLEHYVRIAPYNWFNFYDYWADAS